MSVSNTILEFLIGLVQINKNKLPLKKVGSSMGNIMSSPITLLGNKMRVIGLSYINAIYKNLIRLFILVAVSCVAISANADETGKSHKHEMPAHEQNVEQLLELMGVPDQVDLAADEFLELYSAKIDDDTVDDNVKKLINAYQADLEKIVSAVLSWEAIKLNYINNYASRLSKEDVARVKLFIQSESGQKLIATQKVVGLEIQQVTEHLIEADLTEPLKNLSQMLREGLTKLQATQNPK